MKVNKLISLDYDINEWLKKKDNASKFVNDILRDSMLKEDVNQLNEKQLDIELKIIDLEQKHKLKLEELRNEQRRFA